VGFFADKYDVTAYFENTKRVRNWEVSSVQFKDWFSLFLRPSCDVGSGKTQRKLLATKLCTTACLGNRNTLHPTQSTNNLIEQSFSSLWKTLSVVEGKGFKRLIQVADPKLTIKHRTTY
jgi:hypothetical protein